MVCVPSSVRFSELQVGVWSSVPSSGPKNLTVCVFPKLYNPSPSLAALHVVRAAERISGDRGKTVFWGPIYDVIGIISYGQNQPMLNPSNFGGPFELGARGNLLPCLPPLGGLACGLYIVKKKSSVPALVAQFIERISHKYMPLEENSFGTEKIHITKTARYRCSARLLDFLQQGLRWRSCELQINQHRFRRGVMWWILT